SPCLSDRGRRSRCRPRGHRSGRRGSRDPPPEAWPMRAAARVSLALVALLCASLAVSGSGAGATHSRHDVAFGVADDAWLAHGPGTLESRLNVLSKLGPDVVRFTVRWDRVASTRPANPRDPGDPAYDWSEFDAVLRGLRRHGIGAVVTLYGTPGW